MKYAKGTKVSVEKSKAEIEKLLRSFGASAFVSAWKDGKAIIEFALEINEQLKGLRVRFEMKIPKKVDDKYTKNGYGNECSPAVAERLWESDVRANWRALGLLIKAKMAAVDADITSFESEFLAHIVVPSPSGGTTTTGDMLIPQLPRVYEDGVLPPLLPEGGPEA
jgi:hypothetical protein